MRYRTEGFKGLRTAVTGSLGKAAAGAGSVGSIKTKRCPGLQAQKKSSQVQLQLKAGGFPNTSLTPIGPGRWKTLNTKNWVSMKWCSVQASLWASRKRAVLLTSLIQHLGSFSHSLRNDKDPVQVVSSQHLVSFNSSGSITGEKSAIDLFSKQSYTKIINPHTPLQQLGSWLLKEHFFLSLRYSSNHQ